MAKKTLERLGDGSGSLTARVFKRIEMAILDGTLAPGENLTENRLSTELGVSRTPVREALFQLEQEGLVSITQNKGAVVLGVTVEDIEDIYTIRMLVEGLASRRAAENIDGDEIKALREIVALQDFYVSRGDTAQARNMDTRFHELLYEASRSKMLRNTLRSFHNYVQKAREESFSKGGRAKEAAEEHRRILEALAAGDAVGAERLTAEHIARAKANVLNNL